VSDYVHFLHFRELEYQIFTWLHMSLGIYGCLEVGICIAIRNIYTKPAFSQRV